MSDAALRRTERAWRAGGDPDAYEVAWRRAGGGGISPPRQEALNGLLRALHARTRIIVFAVERIPSPTLQVYLNGVLLRPAQDYQGSIEQLNDVWDKVTVRLDDKYTLWPEDLLEVNVWDPDNLGMAHYLPVMGSDY